MDSDNRMNRKLRVFAAGCLHGDADLTRRLANQAEREKADIVLISGDLTANGKESRNILRPFKEKNQKVFFVTGNHEDISFGNFLAEYYKLKHLHGAYALYDKLGLFGVSGAHIGVHSLSDEDTLEILESGFDKIKHLDKKIMVVHPHPFGSKMEQITGFEGSLAVRMAIDKLQPDLVFCSHLHELQGFEERIGKTRIINVSRIGRTIEI